MKRWSVGVGLIVLGVVCSLVGCKGKGFAPSSAGAVKPFGGPGGPAKPFGGPGDSPVVVQGGAMTARTKDTANGWQGASSPFCTGITTSGLNLNYSDISDKVPGNSVPVSNPFPKIPKGSVALTGSSWMLTILGRSYFPNATNPSQSTNGIVIQPVNNCAALTGASVYVQLSLTGTYPAFYGPDANLKEDGSGTATSMRFRDLTPYDSTGKTSNCFGPNNNSGKLAGDEDVCERASLVTLNTNTTPGGGGVTYSGWCTNGACILGLGDIEQ
jgi:hypothetical protein